VPFLGKTEFLSAKYHRIENNTLAKTGVNKQTHVFRIFISGSGNVFFFEIDTT